VALAPTLLDILLPDGEGRGAPRRDTSGDSDRYEAIGDVIDSVERLRKRVVLASTPPSALDIDGELRRISDALSELRADIDDDIGEGLDDIRKSYVAAAASAPMYSAAYEALMKLVRHQPPRPVRRTRVLVQEVEVPAGGTLEVRFAGRKGAPTRLVLMDADGGGVVGIDVEEVRVDGRMQMAGEAALPAAAFSPLNAPHLQLDGGVGRSVAIKLRSTTSEDKKVQVLLYLTEEVPESEATDAERIGGVTRGVIERIEPEG
jgi:hypothetical protein